MLDNSEILKDINEINEAVDAFNSMELPRFVKEQTDKVFGSKMIKVNYVYNQLIKYRWHSLKENPNDVPPKGKTVMVAFDMKDLGECYELTMYGSWLWEHADIKGWCEIKTFEV